jgi:hypothetical protein
VAEVSEDNSVLTTVFPKGTAYDVFSTTDPVSSPLGPGIIFGILSGAVFFIRRKR